MKNLMPRRHADHCYACRRSLTGQTYWLVSGAAKRMVLCAECADLLADREGAPSLQRIGVKA